MTLKPEEHTKHYQAIGEIVTIAANIDLILFNTFRTISGCGLAVASTIYYAFEALPTKARIIERIAERAPLPPEQIALVLRIVELTMKSNSQRIDVAHSAKVIVDGGETRTSNPRHVHQPTKPISLPGLTATITELNGFLREAMASYATLCRLRNVAPDLAVLIVGKSPTSRPSARNTLDQIQAAQPRPPQGRQD